jgi:nucleoid-associated protein YgaU
MNSSAGKWFTLIIIVATGIVASLPFQESLLAPPQADQPKTRPATSLRISSGESGDDTFLQTAPRPVAGRVHGASLEHPSRRRQPLDRNADSEVQPANGVQPLVPSVMPGWSTSQYTNDATGIGAGTSPPFADSSAMEPKPEVESFGSTFTGQAERDRQYVADHMDADRSVDSTSNSGEETLSDAAYREAEAEPEAAPRQSSEREGERSSDDGPADRGASSSVVGQERDPNESGRNGSRYSDDGSSSTGDLPFNNLPAPRRGNRYSDAPTYSDAPLSPAKLDETPSTTDNHVAQGSEILPTPQHHASEGDLPTPRPRLVIGQDVLPAPREVRGLTADRDDGFRAVPGRPGGVQREDHTIRAPVTRLVRLTPPNQQTSPIRAPAVHTVRDGDTLEQLAKNYWGDASRWRDIYSANRHILADPQLLPIGVRLRIPNDDFHRSLRK